MSTVFISHSSKDASKAAAICEFLEDHGISCWIGPRDVTPGHDYDEEIIDAIDSCDVLLLLLSRNSNESRHVKHEIEWAVRTNKNIIPAKLEDVQPSRKLALHISTRQTINIDQRDLQISMTPIMEALIQFKNIESATSPNQDQLSDERIVLNQASNMDIRARPPGWEMRLFLEEAICTLCRFDHFQSLQVDPGLIEINQEFRLSPTAFADIRVQVPDQSDYFVEVKHGYDEDEIFESLTRKYSASNYGTDIVTRILLIIDSANVKNRQALEYRLQGALSGAIRLDVWDEAALQSELARVFKISLDRVAEDNIEEVRIALDNAKGCFAFGEEWSGTLLQSNLMWHLGFWRINQLRKLGSDLSVVIQAGRYTRVVVLIADLSCFSGYVRDTRDPDVIHAALTSFYTKSRYEILNSGGLLYQVEGDQVIALYGLRDEQEGYMQAALKCAMALTNVGYSVSNEWQQQIDRIQESSGVHIGMALGDFEVVRMRPYARLRFGLVGDGMNIALSLLNAAKAGEVVVNNDYFRKLNSEYRSQFQEIKALDAKNVGYVRAFKASF